jgi:hypothetical protein
MVLPIEKGDCRIRGCGFPLITCLTFPSSLWMQAGVAAVARLAAAVDAVSTHIVTEQLRGTLVVNLLVLPLRAA